MELRQIKDLMAAMRRTRTKRLSIKQNDFELELEQEESISGKGLPQNEGETSHPADVLLQKSTQVLPQGKDMTPSVSSQEEPSGSFVNSPMVGTFYSAASPDEASFVKVGDTLDKDTVVCIIEAMKVMNEVKAGVSGTVSEVLVETGHPVEFGTKLFKIT